MALILDETFATAIPNRASDLDPYSNYVTSYIPFATYDGTTMPDMAPSRSWTNNNVSISTAQTKFLATSGRFTGATNSYYAHAYNADFDFGTGDFTVEAWIYILADSTVGGDGLEIASIYGLNTATPSTTYWQFLINGDATSTGTGLIFNISDAGTLISRTANVTISKDAWHHVAVSKNNLGIYLCLDGVIYPTDPTTLNVNNGSNGLTIGVGSLTSTYERAFNGHISEAKITKGFARYTPNTQAFNVTSNSDPYYNFTVLNLHFNGANNSTTFTDNSFSPKTAVNNLFESNGSPVISTAQSKFGGSSLYLNGSSWIEYAPPADGSFDFGTDEFTIEFWARLDNVTGQRSLIWYGTYNNSGNANRAIEINSNGGFVQALFSNGTSNYGAVISSTVLQANQWYHIAYQRRINNGSCLCYLYINGKYEGASTNAALSINIPSSRSLRIGKYASDISRPYIGYFDDIRITKGIARYPLSSFNVSNTQFPDSETLVRSSSYTSTESSNQIGTIVLSSQLSAHLNFNGSDNSTTFTDITGNTWSSIGTPTIKTAESVFGGSSGYFSIGNYLSLANDSKFNLDVTPFTVELWFKPTDLTNIVSSIIPLITAGRMDSTAGGGGWSLFATLITGTNVCKFTFARYGTDGTVIRCESESIYILRTTNWYHLCVGRDESGFVDLYLNGKRISRSGEFSGVTLSVPNSLSITIGTTGTVASPTLYPYIGYIDSLRVVKGIETYKEEFTLPTSEYQYSVETSYKYTIPYNHLGSICSSYTFATATTISTAATVTYNSTFKAVDYATTVAGVWDLVSLINLPRGEFEIDFEIVSDTGSSRILGLALLNASGTASTTGVGNWIRNNTIVIQNTWNSTAWGANTNTTLFVSDSNTLTANTLNKRKVFNVKWDSRSGVNLTSNTCEVRIDGVLVWAGRLSTLTKARPGIHSSGNTSRIHAIRVWDEPTTSFTTYSNTMYTIDNGVLAQSRLPMPDTLGSRATTTENFGEKKAWYPVTPITNQPVYGLKPTVGYVDAVSDARLTGVITGTVKQSASPTNIPKESQLTLVNETTQAIIARTFSNKNTGEFTFKGLDPYTKYSVYVYDSTKNYRAVILDNVTPISPGMRYVSLTGVRTTIPTPAIIPENTTDSLLTQTNTLLVIHGDYPFDAGPYKRTVNPVSGTRKFKDYTQQTTSVIGARNKSTYFPLSDIDNVNHPANSIVIPYSTDFDLGTGDFTIEFSFLATIATANLFFFGGSTGFAPALGFYLGAGTISFYYISSVNQVSPTTGGSASCAANVWHRCTITRKSGGPIFTYFNGNLIGAVGPFNLTTLLNGRGISFGSLPDGGLYTTGSMRFYLDEFIFTKGLGKPGVLEHSTDSSTNIDSSVKCLLNFEGANNSTTITDSTATATLTASGAAVISTDQFKTGTSSLYLNGSSNTTHVTIGTNAALVPGNGGDVTVECWIQPAVVGVSKMIFGTDTASLASQTGMYCYVNTSNQIIFQTIATTALGSITTISANNWTHIACHKIYYGGTIRLFLCINGKVENYANVTNNGYVTGQITNIGAHNGNFAANSQFNGYIDDFRISVGSGGTSRYHKNFTTGIQPQLMTNKFDFDADKNMGYNLVHIHGYEFIDRTLYNKVVYNIGNATIDSFVKYLTKPVTKLDGGYLKIECSSSPVNLGTGNFTIEFYANWSTNTNGNKGILSSIISQTDLSNRFELSADYNNGVLQYVYSVGGTILSRCSSTVITNIWHHVALVRNSGTTTWYIDGNSINSFTDTTNLISTNGISYGAGDYNNSLNDNIKGYITELRITSLARYTASWNIDMRFPFVHDLYGVALPLIGNSSAITTKRISQDPFFSSTIMMANFENGVTLANSDLSQYNIVPTTGSGTSYIPTITSGAGRFGSYGLYNPAAFDPWDSPIYWTFPGGLNIGTGPVCIEFWAKMTAGSGTSTLKLMPSLNAGSQGIMITMDVFYGRNWMYFGTYSTGAGFGDGSVGAGSWYHFAICRDDSGNVRFFRNGAVILTVTGRTEDLGVAQQLTLTRPNTEAYFDNIRVTLAARYTAAFTPEDILV